MDFTWLITVASIAGAIANIYKGVWGFVFWLIGDIAWMVIDFNAGLISQAVFFAVFGILAVWGIYQWNREKVTD